MEKKNLLKGKQLSKTGRAIILPVTHHLDLIHIAMKFHSYIPYGYQVMMRTRIVCKILIKGQYLRKGEQPFLYVTRHLDLVHIAMKFHQNIPYGYLVIRIFYARRMDSRTTP